MSLDLNKLANKLDEALSNETSETLTKFLTDKRMNNKKQNSIDFIFNAFNLLSDADFKAWMLNTHDFIKAMHKGEIEEAQSIAISKADMTNNRGYFDTEQYYNETFGG